MITATNVNTQVSAAGAPPSIPGDPGSPAGAADFLLELQAALGTPVQAPASPLLEAQTDAESGAKPGDDLEELQNLPTAAVAVLMPPAIFATFDPEIPLPAVLSTGQMPAVQSVSAPTEISTALDAMTPVALNGQPVAGTQPLPDASTDAVTIPPDVLVQSPQGQGSVPVTASIPEPSLGDASEPGAFQRTEISTSAQPLQLVFSQDEINKLSTATAFAPESELALPVIAKTPATEPQRSTPMEISSLALAGDETMDAAQSKDAMFPLAATGPQVEETTEAVVQMPLAPALARSLPDQALLSDAVDPLISNAGNVSTTPSPSPTPMASTLLEPSYRLPLEPHQMRLDGGPVQTEVLKLLRQGGGQIVMELTPPDEGSYRLDLRLDAQGRAYLIVDGASDSVRTRLEQGEAVLREQLSQMGLDLQLNYRQQDQGFYASNASENLTSDGTEIPGSASSPVPDSLGERQRGRAQLEGGLVHLYA